MGPEIRPSSTSWRPATARDRSESQGGGNASNAPGTCGMTGSSVGFRFEGATPPRRPTLEAGARRGLRSRHVGSRPHVARLHMHVRPGGPRHPWRSSGFSPRARSAGARLATGVAGRDGMAYTPPDRLRREEAAVSAPLPRPPAVVDHGVGDEGWSQRSFVTKRHSLMRPPARSA